MASIIVMSGKNQGEFLPLGRRTSVIGRDETFSLQILDDLVSRKHLRIFFDKVTNIYYAEDMSSFYPRHMLYMFFYCSVLQASQFFHATDICHYLKSVALACFRRRSQRSSPAGSFLTARAFNNDNKAFELLTASYLDVSLAFGFFLLVFFFGGVNREGSCNRAGSSDKMRYCRVQEHRL